MLKFVKRRFEMSKIYKISIILITVIFLTFIAKLIKITYFENEEINISINTLSNIFYTKPISTYQSIKLGTHMDEILYVKGNPESVSDEINDINDERVPQFIKDIKPFTSFFRVATKEELEKNNYDYKKYNAWDYKNDVTNTSVFFDENKQVKEIGCFTSELSSEQENTEKIKNQKYCSINNISINTTEDELIKKIGTPTKQSYEGTTKIIDFKKLNLQVRLIKLKIYYIAIRNDL
jgi:hypothetical protein